MGAWRIAGWVVAIAAAIHAGCLSVFGDFFFVDDAQTEFLPFYREMGRIWLSGELPLLSTRTWQGGNFLVDMVVSPFAPQVILTSLVAATVEAHAVAVATLASMNLLLVVASGWWLGRLHRLEDRWALLVGFLLGTQPVFLYVLSANWWNSANAYAWFLFSLAALLHLRQSPGRANFVLALMGACALFACASAQYHLAYGLVAMATVAIDFAERRDLAGSLKLALVPACALLIAAAPLMAEYVAVGDWLPRVSGLHNRRSLLVTHWGMLVHAFTPFYGSHLSWWEGLLYMPVSLAYATVLLFFGAVYFRRPAAPVFEQRWLLALGVVGLLLAVAPAQVGALRAPYRALPVLAAALILWSVQRVATGQWRMDRRRAMAGLGFALLAALVAWFSAQDDLRAPQPMVRLQFTLALLGGGVLALAWLAATRADLKARFQWAAGICAAAWFGGLILTPTLAWVTYPYSELPAAADARPTGRPGNVLGLCGRLDDPAPKDLGGLISGEFLLYGQPSINGYSPVGHNGFLVLFPHSSMHSIFWPRPTLSKISRPVADMPGLHMHQLFRISDILACEKDIDDALVDELDAAGLRVTASLPGKRVLIRPRVAVAETLLIPTSGAMGVRDIGPRGMRSERLDVPVTAGARELYFSRLYWPGYVATLDGDPLKVSPFLRAIVKVEVPPGRGGTLELRYVPTTWRWTRWVLLAGLLVAAAAVWRFPTTRR